MSDPKNLNATMARHIKSALKRSHYSWLPWVCAGFLASAYYVMYQHPSGKTLEIFCNLVVIGGVLLVASGAVVTQEMRDHLFAVKDYDKNPKDKNGTPRPRPTLSDAQIAGLFLDASDKCEAGTLTVAAGSVGLVLNLILGWLGIGLPHP